MPGPKLLAVEVTAEERAELDQLVRRHTTGQQLAERARIILLLADGRNNSEVARAAGVRTDTVRKWRRRWCGTRSVPLVELSVTARLGDAPRHRAPAVRKTRHTWLRRTTIPRARAAAASASNGSGPVHRRPRVHYTAAAPGDPVATSPRIRPRSASVRRGNRRARRVPRH